MYSSQHSFGGSIASIVLIRKSLWIKVSAKMIKCKYLFTFFMLSSTNANKVYKKDIEIDNLF